MSPIVAHAQLDASLKCKSKDRESPNWMGWGIVFNTGIKILDW